MTTETVSSGDIVLSTKGRDKGKYFLVVKVEGKIAHISDGKVRRVTALKKKNVKHLKSVKFAVLTDIADCIEKGQPVGNQKLNKLIKSQIQNKQED